MISFDSIRAHAEAIFDKHLQPLEDTPSTPNSNPRPSLLWFILLPSLPLAYCLLSTGLASALQKPDWACPDSAWNLLFIPYLIAFVMYVLSSKGKHVAESQGGEAQGFVAFEQEIFNYFIKANALNLQYQVSPPQTPPHFEHFLQTLKNTAKGRISEQQNYFQGKLNGWPCEFQRLKQSHTFFVKQHKREEIIFSGIYASIDLPQALPANLLIESQAQANAKDFAQGQKDFESLELLPNLQQQFLLQSNDASALVDFLTPDTQALILEVLQLQPHAIALFFEGKKLHIAIEDQSLHGYFNVHISMTSQLDKLYRDFCLLPLCVEKLQQIAAFQA